LFLNYDINIRHSRCSSYFESDGEFNGIKATGVGIRKKLYYDYIWYPSNLRRKTCVRTERATGELEQERQGLADDVRNKKRIPPYIPDVANHEEPLPNFHESVL